MTDDDQGHATSEALHDVETEATIEQCQYLDHGVRDPSK